MEVVAEQANTKPTIPDGYKRTDVGVIPEDWETSKVSNIGNVIRGASPRPKGDPRYYGGDVPRLMGKDVTRDGKFVTPKTDFLTEEGAKRSRMCEKGTLTIVCSGTVGVPSFLAVDACIHDGFLALTGIRKDVSDDYLYNQMNRLRERFDQSATHGGIFTNLTTEILREFKLPLPPTIEEQRAIAEALSDVDALIAELDALIEKKQQVKKGAMQQLLTGKKRLPGFDGEWEVKKFTEVTNLITCGLAATPKYVNPSRGYPFLSSTNVKNGQIQWEDFKYISEDRHRNLYKNNPPKKGDILYSRVGTIGEAAVIETDEEFSIYVSLTLIKPRRDILDSYFLKHLLNSDEYKRRAKEEVYLGGGVGNLNVGVVREYPIPVPSLEEQKAIAKICSDIEEEIHSLRSKRDKYKQIKQGMMQELLTGKTRLV